MDDLGDLSAGDRYADNIEADVTVVGIEVGEGLGGVAEVLLLAGRHRFFGVAKGEAAAGLNLHNSQYIILVGYYVYLFPACAPVLINNSITFLLQKVCGNLFALYTNFTMFGH